jgi:tetratricopeptide (TPR) repeat protein
MQVGMPEMAVIVLRQATASDPRNREAKQLLGMSLVMTGDAAHAKETFDELLSAEPSPPAYYGRALANYGLKRKADALADIDQAIRLGGANPNLQQWRQKIQALP